MSRNILKEILDYDDEAIVNTLSNFTPKTFKAFCKLAIEQQDKDTREACLIVTGGIIRDNLDASDVRVEILNCKDGLK